MKTLIATTAVIAALTSPVLAGTANDIFNLEAASSQELNLFAGIDGVSNGQTVEAANLFAADAASDDDLLGYTVGGSEVVSTQSFGATSVASAIFAAENAASAENE